jgi:hypothetical protein
MGWVGNGILLPCAKLTQGWAGLAMRFSWLAVGLPCSRLGWTWFIYALGWFLLGLTGDCRRLAMDLAGCRLSVVWTGRVLAMFSAGPGWSWASLVWVGCNGLGWDGCCLTMA